jgi:hypothetical protein
MGERLWLSLAINNHTTGENALVLGSFSMMENVILKKNIYDLEEKQHATKSSLDWRR